MSKKKGKEAWVEPVVDGSKISFEVRQGKCPKDKETLKVGRAAIFKCPVCGAVTTDAYVKTKGKSEELGSQLMAIVAEGDKGRIYVSPSDEQANVANVEKPKNYPNGEMPRNPRWFSPPAFGMYCYLD